MGKNGKNAENSPQSKRGKVAEKWKIGPIFHFFRFFFGHFGSGRIFDVFPVFLIFGVCVPALHECKALETSRKFECSQEKVVIPVFFVDLPSPCFASPASVHFLGPRLAI